MLSNFQKNKKQLTHKESDFTKKVNKLFCQILEKQMNETSNEVSSKFYFSKNEKKLKRKQFKYIKIEQK